MAHASRGLVPGALHRLVAATVLRCKLDTEGYVREVKLDPLVCRHEDEAKLITALDDLLPAEADNALMISFNGASWDLPLLRLRAAATWSFRLQNLPFWWGAEAAEHIDLMRAMAPGEASRWPSLVNASAAVGIDLTAARGKSAATSIQAVSRRCTADVCATLLLHLFLTSTDRSDPRHLAAGWSKLADLILADPRHERLRYFALHEVLPALRSMVPTLGHMDIGGATRPAANACRTRV